MVSQATKSSPFAGGQRLSLRFSSNYSPLRCLPQRLRRFPRTVAAARGGRRERKAAVGAQREARWGEIYRGMSFCWVPLRQGRADIGFLSVRIE